jgi:hypothetical protein
LPMKKNEEKEPKPDQLLTGSNTFLQVLFGDIFADACELLKRKSTHIYLWRFKDAPPELSCQASNVVPLLVNDVETFDTLQQSTTLILEWLIALGHGSGSNPGRSFSIFFSFRCLSSPSLHAVPELFKGDLCINKN